MTRKNQISQAEARRLSKRVDYLEQVLESERRRYRAEYIGNTIITQQWDENHAVAVAVRTARILGHAVVAIERGGLITYRALPHPEVKP